MKDDKKFEIIYTLKDEDCTSVSQVVHTDETFSVLVKDKTLTLINNGDNSWSLVSGEMDQLTVNIIGEAIEQFYRDAGW